MQSTSRVIIVSRVTAVTTGYILISGTYNPPLCSEPPYLRRI